MLSCIGFSAAVTGLLGLLLGHLLHYYYLSLEGRFILSSLALLFCVFLGRLIFVLGRQVFVFDKALGQVAVNGRPVHPLAELQCVCLERSYYDGTTSRSLSLHLKNKVQMQIMADGLFGTDIAEMQGLAETIAEFAGLDLVTPKGFVPAVADLSAVPSQPKKIWRRKGIRRS